MRSIIQGCLLGALLLGVWYGTRAETVTIRAVSISGIETASYADVARRVDAALAGSYAVLVPKRFAYTYPRRAIVREVERIPRIASATVERVSRTDIVVAVTEHTPAALWCAHEQADSCVFITDEGIAFAEAPELHGTVFIRYSAEGMEPQVGEEVGTSRFIESTREFARALFMRHGMRVHSIVRTQDGDVRYRIFGGGELLTAASAPIADVFGNLDSLLFSDTFEHLESGDFYYIDLRFGNRIFVKERVEEGVVDVAIPTTTPTPPSDTISPGAADVEDVDDEEDTAAATSDSE